MSQPAFGIESASAAALQGLFERSGGLERVWIIGSRARGQQRPNSDIDFVVDAPGWQFADLAALEAALRALPIVYPVDLAWWQDSGLSDVFRAEVERDRQLFWAPPARRAAVEEVAGVGLKGFQREALAALAHWLEELARQAERAARLTQALRAEEGAEDLAAQAADFPRKAWERLREQRRLPPAFADRAHSSRWDGAGRPVPNACLKVPTGGGKTLLAAAAVGAVFGGWLRRHTGMVLWIVPNEAIYRQTMNALNDRDHPYRQLLNVAGAGRVRILDKNTPLTRLDAEGQLCVMVLMLQSAARQTKETLRLFRDRGSVLGFLPPEDDVEAHWALLQRLPNLDVYASSGTSADEARTQKGSIVKSSLGNALRLMRPLVIIDEGHHAYSETALSTIEGFNPCLLLELSATPRVSDSAGKEARAGKTAAKGSNILVDVRGRELDEAEMIKLPIHVDVRRWNDWQSCLAASVRKLDELAQEAERLRGQTARYIRPLLLVQVERTGADLRDAGFIHAEDARAYLLQLGLNEAQIAIKTSERNDLNAPENIDLLSPTCPVRAIITKQALQEGWDCPYAYVLCALAAGRAPAAMTQLVGRILRMPQVTKTGIDALDSCWVYCHDARTGDVVRSIKQSLEGEGMGDLAISVSGDGADEAPGRPVTLVRRPPYRDLRLFVPRVCWVEPDARRRELDYESDVLAHLPWHALDATCWAGDWAPDATGTAMATRFAIDLNVLSGGPVANEGDAPGPVQRVDSVRLARALADLAPNAWLVHAWVDTVLAGLRARGLSEHRIAASEASLVERLRLDIEAARDSLAEGVFRDLLAQGRIEFRLRADGLDAELPLQEQVQVDAQASLLCRLDDQRPIEKSLLEPAYRLDLNDFELRVAGYLDQQGALRWWHRNVARRQLGLQGWKRHKVYPDFVFGLSASDGRMRTVLLETKGAHLAGEDTQYKQRLLAQLSAAFKDARFERVGELTLAPAERQEVACDLVFDQDWRGSLNGRWFSGEPA